MLGRILLGQCQRLGYGARVADQRWAALLLRQGYCDYSWWHKISLSDALFVTRFKRNAVAHVEETCPLPEADRGQILADEIVRFSSRRNRAGHTNPYEAPLPRVTVARPTHSTPIVLATNDLDSSATTIAENYKARWSIELFFKWVKQHLNLTRFLGRSESAVKIQILTSLVAYLLVVLYRQAHASGQSLWHCLAVRRASLFRRPHIEDHHRRVHERRRRQVEALSTQGKLFS